MRARRLEPSICFCAHREVTGLNAKCSACGAAHTDRVTKTRMKVLEALALRGPDDPPLHIEPIVRTWLVTRGLIIPTEPRIEPSDEKRNRRPVRRHVLTPRGAVIRGYAAPPQEQPLPCTAAVLASNEVVAASTPPSAIPLPTGSHDRADCPCDHPAGEVGPCGGCNCADPVPSADALIVSIVVRPPPTSPPCTDFAPAWFTGRWRDWHRGHGCDLDDGAPRTAEGTAEIDSARDRRVP